MDTILFLAHAEPDGSLTRAALEALTAAQDLAAAEAGATLAIGLVGPEAESAAAGLASAAAARIIVATSPELSQARYATDAAVAEAMCRASGATLVVAPATSRWT